LAFNIISPKENTPYSSLEPNESVMVNRHSSSIQGASLHNSPPALFISLIT